MLRVKYERQYLYAFFLSETVQQEHEIVGQPRAGVLAPATADKYHVSIKWELKFESSLKLFNLTD